MSVVVLPVRREQAESMAALLSELRVAQERADHFGAGVLAGLVPSGSGVLSADAAASTITVSTPDVPPKEPDAPSA